MDNITKKVKEEIDRGWIGPDMSCEYHPCHFEGQDCSFCFCPFYPCKDEDLGQSIESRRGKPIWECTYCLFIHRPEVGRFVMSEIKRLGIEDPSDKRMSDIFKEAKARYYREGKAIMVLGATSDAGKSLTVMALCRILHRRGYLVSPFKSQNMSLNSRVTMKGFEVAMIQTIQSRAAGLKNADHHMNPILLKPKGDSRSQVIVEGLPYGDYSTKAYYEDFVPGPGTEIVKRNIGFLKKRYDYVVMEGAGSPAEINIYDRDIANMRAAEIADAECILVINVEWGGSFAYAAGTVALLEENDRKRVKGIILNNVRGSTENMVTGAGMLENVTGIPVIGIIPRIEGLELPSEDSEAFRDSKSKGSGSLIISVIRLPRIANFTDLDPLCMEDTTLRFVTSPEELEGSDALIIPGTKNTIEDLKWMKDAGFDNAICDLKGKIPILGICGGYQMMGKVLKDPEGIEGGVPGEMRGLGLFDNVTEWKEYRKKVTQDRGTLIADGEPVTGYEIHMGMSEIKELPLFNIERFGGDEKEGSFREEEMLFGTYLHGVFDKPAFRRFFLSFVKHREGPPKEVRGPEDYDEVVEESIDRLADAFEKNMDLDAFSRIFG